MYVAYLLNLLHLRAHLLFFLLELIDRQVKPAPLFSATCQHSFLVPLPFSEMAGFSYGKSHDKMTRVTLHFLGVEIIGALGTLLADGVVRCLRESPLKRSQSLHEVAICLPWLVSWFGTLGVKWFEHELCVINHHNRFFFYALSTAGI